MHEAKLNYTVTLILVCNLGMSVTTTYYLKHEIVAVKQATEVLLLDPRSGVFQVKEWRSGVG